MLIKNKKVKSKIFHFDFFQKNCRGEMTTQQIVIFIILIASFAVLLFFLFRLNLGSETEKEICHNSVIVRGSSVVSTEAVPLDCKRSYVCITEDGSCESMTKPIEKKVKTKEDIYDVLAKEMVDCWWMFGEGKVNYVGEDLIPGMYCSICSQIAFDNSVKEILEEGELDKEEFYNYLYLKNMTGSDETYLDYLGLEEYYNNFEEEFGIIDLDKQYYVLTGMNSDVSTWGYVAVGGLIVGGIAFAPFTFGGSAGFVAGTLLAVGGGTVGYFVAPVVQGEVGNRMISPSLIEVNSEEFEGLGCKKIVTIS